MPAELMFERPLKQGLYPSEASTLLEGYLLSSLCVLAEEATRGLYQKSGHRLSSFLLMAALKTSCSLNRFISSLCPDPDRDQPRLPSFLSQH